MTMEAAMRTHGEVAAADSEAGQYLTFTIGEEEFAVDIMIVREIKGWAGVTRLPNAPAYVRGVINLRGVILPIFDLRARFGMGETQATEKNVVIMLAVGDRTIGVLVDTVSDILTASKDEIKSAPDMQTNIDDAYVNGLISVDERMVVLLEVKGLFDRKTLDAAIQAADVTH